MNILFIGSLGIPAKSLLPLLSENGFNVSVVNTGFGSYDWGDQHPTISVRNLYRSYSAALFSGEGYMFRKMGYYLINGSNRYISLITEVIREKQIDLILSSWGSWPLPEVYAIKRHVPNIPVTHEFRSYPINTHPFLVKLENLHKRMVFEKMDGLIYNNEIMRQYMQDRFSIENTHEFLFMGYFPKQVFPYERLPALSMGEKDPHLIFIGKNNVGINKQVQGITRHGINLHMLRDTTNRFNAKSYSNRFLHYFDGFEIDEVMAGDLSTYITQFDACLVTYPSRFCLGTDRCRNSLPDRFLFSLTAGIPLVLPKGCLAACERIVRKHKIGFVYNSPKELRAKLENNEMMHQYARNALSFSEDIHLENKLHPLKSFFEKIVSD